jgi:hypothetical protein
VPAGGCVSRHNDGRSSWWPLRTCGVASSPHLGEPVGQDCRAGGASEARARPHSDRCLPDRRYRRRPTSGRCAFAQLVRPTYRRDMPEFPEFMVVSGGFAHYWVDVLTVGEGCRACPATWPKVCPDCDGVRHAEPDVSRAQHGSGTNPPCVWRCQSCRAEGSY